MIMHGKGLSWSRPATLLALAAAATGCDARDALAPRLAADGKASAQLGPFAISRLGLGTARMGGATPRAEAHRMLDRFGGSGRHPRRHRRHLP